MQLRIRALGVLVVALCAAACGREPVEASPPMPGVAIDPQCGALPDELVLLERFEKRVSRDWTKVRFADDYEAVRGRPVGAPLAFGYRCSSAGYLLGDGAVVDIAVPGRANAQPSPKLEPGAERILLQSAYVEPEGDGFVIHAVPPRALYATMAVTAVRGDMWLSFNRRWMAVDLDVDVTTSTGRVVLDGLQLESPPATWRRAQHGFRLTSIKLPPSPGSTRQGSAPWVMGPDGALIISGLPAGRTTIHMRLEGWPPIGSPYFGPHGAFITGVMPYVPFQDAFPRHVTIHHPADEAVAAGGAVSAPSGSEGWRSLETRSTGTGNYIVVVHPTRRMTPVVVEPYAGTRLKVANQFTADDCRVGLTRAASGLAALGPLGDIVVQEFTLPADYEGYQSERLALLDADHLLDLCQGPDHVADPRSVAVAAHEMAHTWFGAEVSATAEEATAWWEALAEYVSAWALESDPARQLRGLWATSYAQVSSDDTVAMNRRILVPRDRSNRFNYSKGPLLITALEDRIGKDRVVAVLRRFIDDNRGKAGSWAAVVAAVRAEAGNSHATWLHTWLSTPGAPDLRFSGVTIVDVRIHGTVVQSAPAFPGAVQIAFLRGDQILSRSTLPLAGERSPFDFAIPAGADSLAIDPEHRLPLRYDPAADPVAAGRRVRLAEVTAAVAR